MNNLLLTTFLLFSNVLTSESIKLENGADCILFYIGQNNISNKGIHI